MSHCSIFIVMKLKRNFYLVIMTCNKNLIITFRYLFFVDPFHLLDLDFILVLEILMNVNHMKRKDEGYKLFNIFLFKKVCWHYLEKE